MAGVRGDRAATAPAAELIGRPSRLRALAELEATAESAAQALDRIAGTACRVLRVPVVLVNLVGADRQRFVGCGAGGPPWSSTRELPLTHGFCPFALAADDALAFADARRDPALAGNPAVTELGVVAYAGVPLRATGGEPVGTLCALDHEPHEWSADDLALLGDLAAGATAELQLLAATRWTARHRERLRALAAAGAELAAARTPGELADALLPAARLVGVKAVRLLTDAELPAQAEFAATRSAVRQRFPAIRQLASDAGSGAVLPLTSRRQPLGLLLVARPAEESFSDDEREYLAALAAAAAIGLAGIA